MPGSRRARFALAALVGSLPIAGCATRTGRVAPRRDDVPTSRHAEGSAAAGDGSVARHAAAPWAGEHGTPSRAVWTSGNASDPRPVPRAPETDDGRGVEAPTEATPPRGSPSVAAYPVPAEVPLAARLVTPRALRLDATADDATSLGNGFAVPSASSRGIAGSRLRAVVSVRAPDAVDGGIFYAVDDRLTIGFLGQRLEQERTSNVDGQLVDPGDPSSYVEGFSVRERVTSVSCGPFVQVRLATERGWRPELAIGAYALEWGTLTSAETRFSEPSLIVDQEASSASSGDPADKYRCVYVSASKHLRRFDDASFVRGVRGYGGIGYGARIGDRFTAAATGGGDPRIRMLREEVTHETLVGWVGAEAALPRGFSFYGEAFTGDDCELGYAVGLRWASPVGITFTLAFTECVDAMPSRPIDLVYLPGGVGGQPSVFSGGSGLQGGSVGPPSLFDDEAPPPPRRAPRTPPSAPTPARR